MLSQRYTRRANPGARIPASEGRFTPGATQGRRRRKQGGTLLEVILTLGLGTFVLLSACQMVITTAVSSVSARQNTLAYNAARAVLENIRLYQGTTLANGTYADARSFGPVPQLAALPEAGVSATIATYRTAPTATVKIVTITVRWNGTQTTRGSGMRKTRKLTVLVSPKGVTP